MAHTAAESPKIPWHRLYYLFDYSNFGKRFRQNVNNQHIDIVNKSQY